VPLITAIGASFFLQYTFRCLYTPGFKAYPEVQPLKGTWTLFGLEIQRMLIAVFVSSLLLLLLLYAFVQFTKVGRAIRAVAEDQQAAALMGVDVDRTISITFAVGGAAAGAAGGASATCPGPCWAASSWACSNPWGPVCSWRAWGFRPRTS